MRIIIANILLFVLAGCSSSYYVSEREQHRVLPDSFDENNHEYYKTYVPAGLYPKNLCDSGFEGYVVVEFDIDERGKTQNHKVVESDAAEKFGTLATLRVQGTLYDPRTIRGKPLPVRGVQTRFEYCVDACRNPENNCQHRSVACQ